MNQRVHSALVLLIVTALFVLSWILRYNDPEGSLGGVSDDHLFYAVQGWQLLLGEFPDRDFFDPGAPLTYMISAALQVVAGRSIWSDYAFSILMLSLGSAITFVLATRLTGSIALGIVAAAFEIALRPRLYNYPKIIIYAIALAAIWAWIRQPRGWRTWLLAAVTVFALLMRHDHGIYVAAAVLVAFAGRAFGASRGWNTDVTVGSLARTAGVYVAATVLVLLPYLFYLQVHGGIITHFQGGARYSAQDYQRAPLILPRPSLQPVFTSDGSDPEAAWWERDPFKALDEHHYTWWLYWFLMLQPLVALALLHSRSLRSSSNTLEWLNVLVLAVLAFIVDVRLLRGNLAGRFADVAVPAAILAAWSLAGVARIVLNRSGAARWTGSSLMSRGILVLATLLVVAMTAGVLTRSAAAMVEGSSLTQGIEAIDLDARRVTRLVERTWPLEMWTDETNGQIGVAKYLTACTSPEDRILMVPFAPQVLALAQRGFAGGRLDLRGSFWDTPREQQLTVERLNRQSVPIAIGPPVSQPDSFRHEFPIVSEHVEREYRPAGEVELQDGTYSLLIRRDATVLRTYGPRSLPCFG